MQNISQCYKILNSTLQAIMIAESEHLPLPNIEQIAEECGEETGTVWGCISDFTDTLNLILSFYK